MAFLPPMYGRRRRKLPPRPAPQPEPVQVQAAPEPEKPAKKTTKKTTKKATKKKSKVAPKAAVKPKVTWSEDERKDTLYWKAKKAGIEDVRSKMPKAEVVALLRACPLAKEK